MPTAAETMAERRWLTGGRAYPQIASRIRDQVHTGQFPSGTVLPSEAELCRTFGVARNTVRRALAVLEDEGLVVTVPSKGHVVAGQPGTTSYRYQEIAATLREQIQSGDLAPGAALPSEAALGRRFDTSRNTVRQALAALEHEGLIVAEHGRGRFVRD